MEYLKTGTPGIWIEFDPDRGRSAVIREADLRMELEMLKNELAELPPDEILLAWAKENYQGINFNMLTERQKEIAAKLKTLEAIK